MRNKTDMEEEAANWEIKKSRKEIERGVSLKFWERGQQTYFIGVSRN